MYYINLDVDAEERFDMAKFMEVVEGGHDILTSYFIDQAQKLPVFGSYEVVNEEFRPWLVSHRIYGNTQYWWIILLYNGLVDPYDVRIGMELSYPSLSQLEDLYYQLKTRESRENT